MNAVSMIFQQASSLQLNEKGSMRSEDKENKTTLFQSLLMGNRDLTSDIGKDKPEKIDSQTTLQSVIESVKQLLANVDNNESGFVSQLEEMLANMNGLNINTDANLASLLTELQRLLQTQKDNGGHDDKLHQELDLLLQSLNSTSHDLSFYQIPMIWSDFSLNPIDVDTSGNSKNYESVLSKVEQLLQRMENKEISIAKAAPQLLELLKEWMALGKNSGELALNSRESTKEIAIWKELVQSFQKREQLNNTYQHHAKVTTKDVVKWLENTLGKQNTSNYTGINPDIYTKTSEQLTEHQQSLQTNLSSQVTFMSSSPISKLEQYVIHVQQTQNSQPVEQQIMDQFQKVMKTSKFLSMPNGTNQLSIALRPDNLGEMMIRLTQINGEMMVKIAVTSQATKEILESNINQLRNMFSPNQVVIERQDVHTSQQGQDLQYDQEEQPFDDQNQGQSDQSSDEDLDGEKDFESTFQDILLNEKV